MKLNSTIGLTLILLASMLIAGVFSAVAGMSLGREALKGITQPDTRPTNNLANRKGDAPRKNELTVLQEDQIIAKVKARIGGKPEPAAKAIAVKTSNTQTKLPISVKNEGVFLEVKSVESQGDSLVLLVSLKNETADPVKFLYSFLEIKDEQGRVLSTTTEGLPAELPPDNELYSGNVRIPITSIDKAQKLSLALSDYPDQQVQLKLSNIPVSR